MTPQEEKELLLRVVTKLAGKQLEQEGEFITFGATLGSNRDVRLLMPKSMKQDVTRDELDAYWVRTLRQAIAAVECGTVCSCVDVRLQTNDGAQVTALLIHVEHAHAFSEDILYPYRKDEDAGIVFGEPTSETRERKIFTCSRETS